MSHPVDHLPTMGYGCGSWANDHFPGACNLWVLISILRSAVVRRTYTHEESRP